MAGIPVTLEGVSNTPVDVRLSPGALVGGWGENLGALDGYIAFFDRPAAQVVLGTTKPYYYVRCFSFSTSFLIRGDEAVAFGNAISVAGIASLTLGGGPPIGINTNVVVVIS